MPQGTLQWEQKAWVWKPGFGTSAQQAEEAICNGIRAAQASIARLLNYQFHGLRVDVQLNARTGPSTGVQSTLVDGRCRFKDALSAGAGYIRVPLMTLEFGSAGLTDQRVLKNIELRTRHEMGHLLLALATGQREWAEGRSAAPLPDWLASAVEWDLDDKVHELAAHLVNRECGVWSTSGDRSTFHDPIHYPEDFNRKISELNLLTEREGSFREATIGHAIIKMTKACPQIAAKVQLRMLLSSYSRFRTVGKSDSSPLQNGRLRYTLMTDDLGVHGSADLTAAAAVGMMASILQIEDHHHRSWGDQVGACICSRAPYVVISESIPIKRHSQPTVRRLEAALQSRHDKVATTWRGILGLDSALEREARVCWSRALARALETDALTEDYHLGEMRPDQSPSERWCPAVVLIGAESEGAKAWRDAWTRLEKKLVTMGGHDERRFRSWLPDLVPDASNEHPLATSDMLASKYGPILAVYVDELTTDLLSRARNFAADRVVWSAVFPTAPRGVLDVRPYELLQSPPRPAIDPRYREDAWEMPQTHYPTIEAEVLRATETGRLTTPLSWLLAFLRIGFFEDFPAEPFSVETP